jgi:hypothetical protein
LVLRGISTVKATYQVTAKQMSEVRQIDRRTEREHLLHHEHSIGSNLRTIDVSNAKSALQNLAASIEELSGADKLNPYQYSETFSPDLDVKG